MYKTTFSFFACIMCLLYLFIPKLTQAVEETKIKMELWNRYTAKFEAGGMEKIEKSEFALKRGYFRVEPKFTDKIKGRFNFDMFSDDDAEDGAGLKLKYAYVSFSELLPLPDSTFTFGLQKNYFGVIYDWDYTTIEKAPADKYKIASSADYGISFTGYLPAGYGEYGLTVYNGEGYKKVGGDIDENPAICLNLRFIVIPGVTIGGSGSYENRDGKELTKTAAVSRLVFGPLDTWVEYLNQLKTEKSERSQVIMIMPVIRLGVLDIVTRYDYVDSDIDTTSDDYQLFIGGLNIHILKDAKDNPALWLQLNYETKQYINSKKNEEKQTHEIMAQLRWKFGTKI